MSREKFEVWASDDGKFPLAVERAGDSYRFLATQNNWEVWQAATASMQAERDQLAAECAALKESREVLAKNSLESCNEIYCAGYRNTALHDGLMESTGDRDKYPNPIRTLVDEAKRHIETPATDRFLAEQRAQGVEMFAEKCSSKSKQAISSDTRDSWWLCGEHASDFAAQLRNEVKV